MRRNKRATACIVGALAVTSLTACGDDGAAVEEEPKDALSEAIEALADYDGIELTFGVDGDREAIAAAADGDMADEEISLLLDSSVVLRAAGESEEDAQAEVLVDLGGERVVELRFLPEQELFVRIDLDAMGTAVDDPSLASGIDEAVVMAEQFGFGELATSIRDGDWVQLTGLEQLTELAGGSSAPEEPSDEEVEDVRQRIVDALQDFLDSDVDVTYRGEEDPGQRVTAATTQAALAELTDEITTIAGDLGVDGEQFGLDTDAPEAGDEPVEIEFWLQDGRVSQIGIDLAAMDTGDDAAPEGTFVLAGIAEFSDTVATPDDATEIDLFAIVGGLMGGLEGGGLEGGGLGDTGAGDAGADDGASSGDEATPDDAVPDDLPLGDECIPQEQLDMLTGGDAEADESLQSAIDQGLIEIC